MPLVRTIGYQSSFRKAVPVRRAGCIRVTHPSAARQQALLLLLPPDLHVLGLPLAFILSQDQTLRCINSFYLSGGLSFMCLPVHFCSADCLSKACPPKRLVLPVQFYQCPSANFVFQISRCKVKKNNLKLPNFSASIF